MAFDFPASPTNGQIYSPSGGPDYIWNSTTGAWEIQTGGTNTAFVAKGGDTMTGPLVLPGNAATDLQAVPLQQVRAYAAPFDAMAYNGIQVNGGMDVSQRYGAALIPLVNTSALQTLDRWWGGFAYNVGGQLNIQQLVTGGTPLAPGVYIDCIMQMTSPQPISSILDPGSWSYMVTLIEGTRAHRLGWGHSGAMPLTIGFWIHTKVAGTINMSVHNLDHTLSYTTEVVLVANVWQYKTVTIPGPTTGVWARGAANQIWIAWVYTCGSANRTASPNTWNAENKFGTPAIGGGLFQASNCQVNLTGVTMFPGIYAPTAAQSAMVMRRYGEEMLLAQRYNCPLEVSARFMASNSGHTMEVHMNWKAQMQGVPTVTLVGPPVASNNINPDGYPGVHNITDLGARFAIMSVAAGDTFYLGQKVWATC